ncbi:MAG: hypothetical protein LBL19_01850 [Spirochaetaceae bacterium]|jgi:hypothetical protein|nr:hypothetical protein [Spirochaetaceae bacterium]
MGKMLAAKNPIINEAYCKLQGMSEDGAKPGGTTIPVGKGPFGKGWRK